MKMNVLLLLFLAAMVVRSTSQPPNRIPLPYDYYSVVFQWAESVCNFGRYPYQCRKQIRPAFTLHGLWPDRYNSPPLDCTKISGYTPFNINLIPVSYRNMLTQYWPNMCGQDEFFWGIEYEKHGSCMEQFYSNQLRYFVTALRVPTSIDLYSILAAAGILCGNPTTVGAVRTAIHASTGFWPTVQCNKNLVGTLQLYQIYLCFDKTRMMQIDCIMSQKGCIDPNVNPNYQIDYPRPYEYLHLLPPKRHVYFPPPERNVCLPPQRYV